MGIYYNLDLKVKFTIENFGKEYYQYVTKFYTDMWSIDNIEVSIKECSKVYIEFYTEEPNSRLVVENIYKEEGEAFKLNPGENKMLFELENNYSMLVPGNYTLKVYLNGVKYYAMFEIIPRHINDIQLKNLRDFVNSEVRNLSYNMSSKLQMINTNTKSDYISFIKQYSESYKELKFCFNSIMKNPYVSLNKKIIKNGKVKKTDKKTIQLNSKGINNYEYSFKKVKEYCNKENILIKSIAIKMINTIKDIEAKLGVAYKQKKIEEEMLRKDFEFKKTSINIVKDINRNSREIVKKIKSYDKSVSTLNSTMKRKQGIKENIYLLKDLKAALIIFIKSPYMKDIPFVNNTNYKGIRINDYRYKSILDIYKQIHIGNKNKSISYKPSELIYEYFIYLAVIKIFRDKGFKLENCMFKDIIHGEFLEKIPKGCLAKFSRDNLEIRVWYEKELLSLPDESIKFGDGFYTHAPNKLPDIRVDYVYNNVVKKSLIVESKYRRYSYLWNEFYNTSTMIQIKNYKTTIRYFYDKNKKPKDIINKVVVVYPGEEGINNIISKEFGDYIFLQLKPGENNDIYGIEDLKKILEENIESFSS